MKLTGIKDVNYLIFDKLDDRSLLRYCISHKNACNDDEFWKRRLIKKFGKMSEMIIRPENRTWKKHYLTIIKDLDIKNPWKFLQIFPWNLNDNRISEIPQLLGQDETFTNRFWLLNLGKKVTIHFPVGEDIISKRYESKTYLTPFKIMQIIYNFYHEKIDEDELLNQQNEGNQEAMDYDFDDIGDVERIEILGPIHFGGIQEYKHLTGEHIYSVILNYD